MQSEQIKVWDDEIIEALASLQEYLPLSVESRTRKYLNNLFEAGYSDSEFYNNLYLNMYHFYIFTLHSFLVKVYKIHMDEKSVQVLHKVKAIGKKVKDIIKLDKLRHDAFNYVEKDSIKHLCYLLELEEDSNLQKRHSDIFKMRDNISHFNETTISKDVLLEYLGKINENLICFSEKIYQDIKLLICSNIQECIDNDVIDKENYASYFDEWNYSLYLSNIDYKVF